MTAYTMERLSAWELLRLRRETSVPEDADEAERALWLNAALLARCLRTEDGTFSGAEAVLRTLGAGEINDLVARYARLDRAEDPERQEGVNAGFDEARWRALREEARA